MSGSVTISTLAAVSSRTRAREADERGRLLNELVTPTEARIDRPSSPSPALLRGVDLG